MATVTDPRTFDRDQTQRRVRHPLEALRGYIRWYVVLEGAAVAVIFLALWFWIGLALDFGSFKLWAFDWIQELQQATLDAKTGQPSQLDGYIRLALLGVLIAGLLGLVAWKVFLRFFREFSDRALALVLERRFRKELGDRLITAVELADPREAEKLGYSRQLVEKTIMDAADRVEKVPVKEVFDWRRLQVLWMWCGILTLGMYILVGVVSCVYGAASGGSASPFDYMWRFQETAGIWAERNLLLQNSFWPRRAYLELVRFPETPEHPGQLRVPRDEQRPDVLIRSVQWVVADTNAPDGWRPLRWKDLEKYLPKAQLDKVAIPADFDRWEIDLDDLDANVPAGLIPTAWQGKTSGEIRHALLLGAYREAFKNTGLETPAEELFDLAFLDRQLGLEGLRLREADAAAAFESLLDWHNWTVDKLVLQHERTSVRQALRNNYNEANDALQKVFSELEGLADSARMSRRLRKLEIPADVTVHFRGDNTKLSKPLTRQGDNKYTWSLNELKETVHFTVRGDDYYTRSKQIILVPPPSLTSLTIDKEEPAYIYYRLQGDQMPLKGKRQIFKDFKVSVDGDMSAIRVPIGTSLTLHATLDRPLKPGLRVRAPVRSEESGSLVPQAPVILGTDKKSFTLALDRVVRTYDFFVEYNDLDSVKGRRRIKVAPVDDRPPEILDFEPDLVLRKPRFSAEPLRTSRGVRPDGFLITPDALLPFKGIVKDDYGLSRVAWAYEVEQVSFELIGGGSLLSFKSKTDEKTDGKTDGKDDSKVDKKGDAAAGVKQAGLLVGGIHVISGNPVLALTAPVAMQTLLRDLAPAPLPRAPELEKLMEEWEIALAGRAKDEIPASTLAKLLTEKPPGRALLKEHQLKSERGFDMLRFVPALKVSDPTDVQRHYQIEIGVKAADNNVETGPNVGRPKTSYSFLVVSENELLSQIAIEEQILLERLEKVYNKLTSAKINMDEQARKLDSAGADFNLVSIRVEAARKDLLDAASTCRDVHYDYFRIYRELEVNRARAKTEKVFTKIVLPLEEINRAKIENEFGTFATADEAFQKLYQGIDDDITNKVGDSNRVARLGDARATSDNLTRLADRVNAILIEMQEGVNDAQALQRILEIQNAQLKIREQLDRQKARLDLETLESLKNVTK